MADNDPIKQITVEFEYDEDQEEDICYLYCRSCDERVVDGAGGSDVLALYLAARGHVAEKHS